MKILFVHHAFPGQFKHLAATLASDPTNQVTFITHSQSHATIPGVTKVAIKADYSGIDPTRTHPYLRFYESLIQTGDVVYGVCRDLVEKRNMRFDVVVAHHGAGVGLFVRDAFPDTPILTYQEYFPPAEQDAQRTFPPQPRDAAGRKSHRVFLSHLLNQLVWTDWSVTPTFWQRSTFPADFHSRISVLHDGINTVAVNRGAIPMQSTRLPGGTIISPNDELVTYVARNFDTVRGFPTVMRAIKIIRERRPQCRFVLLGGDNIGYGDPPPEGNTWREFMIKETGLDASSVHMPGQVDYPTYLRLLRLSKAHIYLTTGFVLSWSVLEAMAAECLVIGSETPPVQEVMQHGVNGLLADFHAPEQIADCVVDSLAKPDAFRDLRCEARRTIEARYALKDILPLQTSLLRDLASGNMPPKTAEVFAQRNSRLGLDKFRVPVDG